MNPFHRIGRNERQCARQHLIECDAEGVEIAAAIDRAVHPPRLLGSHIGQRARDKLGRLEPAWRSRGSREAIAESRQPRLGPSPQFTKKIGGLNVLMDEAAPVHPAERGGDADREAQETPGSMGAPMRRSSGSPPGSSSRSRAFPCSCRSSNGRAAQVESSSSLSANSWARRSSAAGGEWPAAGKASRTDGSPPSPATRRPRQRMRSPSSDRSLRSQTPSTPS